MRHEDIKRQPESITAAIHVQTSRQSERVLRNQDQNFQLLATGQRAHQASIAQIQADYARLFGMVSGIFNVATKIDKQTTVSEKDAEDIIDLKDEVEEFKSSRRIPISVRAPGVDSDMEGEIADSTVICDGPTSRIDAKFEESCNDSLTEAMERLCTLASFKEKKDFKATDDEHALQSIIEDLGKILELASSEIHFQQTQQVPSWLRKHGTDHQNPDRALMKVDKSFLQSLDLKRMMGMLHSTRSVAIQDRGLKTDITPTLSTANHIEALPRASRASRNQFTIRNDIQSFESDFGTFAVLSTVHQAKGKQKANETSAPVENAQEVFSGSISFMPHHSSSRYKIAASFLQKSMHEGSYSMAPQISFCAIIPAESKVFRRIQSGDLEGLIDMLELNLASLQDCDPLGRSLLNVRLC